MSELTLVQGQHLIQTSDLWRYKNSAENQEGRNTSGSPLFVAPGQESLCLFEHKGTHQMGHQQQRIATGHMTNAWRKWMQQALNTCAAK